MISTRSRRPAPRAVRRVPEALLGALSLVSLPLLAAETPHDAESGRLTLDDVVVSGKRLESDRRSARVWTEIDLARESGRTVGELLRESAGIDAISGTGGNSNVLIRGAGGSQTLVIVDGVKANDPSASNRYFDWSRLDVRQVERIEVLKGPQAVSYGSDAIGGVVLVTTRRGQTGHQAAVEGGSGGFFRARAATGAESASADGFHRRFRITAFAKSLSDARSSALAAPSGGPVEGDGARELAGGAAFSADWRNRFRADLSLDVRAATEDIDGGAFDDDPNSVARNRELRGAANFGYRFGESLEAKALVSRLDFRRAYANALDATHADPIFDRTDAIYRGANTRVEATLAGRGSVEWTGGAEYVGEDFRLDSLLAPAAYPRDSDRVAAVFAEAVAPVGPLTLDGGARLSDFASFGRQASGKAGATWPARDGRGESILEIDAGISTGFKAPTLYSLYDPTYGNPALRPEESVQIEAGAALRPDAATRLALRAFGDRVRDRFGYDPSTFRALNVARAEIRGAELEAERRLGRGVRLQLHYTRLQAKDRATGAALDHVARDKGGLKLHLDPDSRYSFVISALAKGRRPAGGAARLPGFLRLDLATRHRLGEAWTLTTRIENLLDRRYQEIRGYRAAGFSGFLGLEFATL